MRILWTVLGLGLALIATAAPAAASENPTPKFLAERVEIEQLLKPVGYTIGGDGASVGDYKFENPVLDPDEFNIEALSWQRYLQQDQNRKNN